MLPILTPLLAVFLPLGALIWMQKRPERPLRRPWLFSLGSFAACSAAVCLELGVLGLRAERGDISGILDTWRAALAISVGLAVVTLLVNLLFLSAAFPGRKNKK